MKKKQIIGLGTLLLVCLLGLFTISYADENRTWTENNIKNAIYNYRYSKGQTDAQIQAYFNTNASYITTVTNAFNSYRYVTIMYQTSGSLSNMAFQVSNGQGKWYLSGNQLYSSNTNDSKYWIFPSSGTAWQNNGFCNVFFNPNYYYTSKDIYENGSSNTIRLQANSSIPTNLITSPYEDRVPFSFVEASTNTYADVWSYEDVPFYIADSNEDLYIGNLIVPDSVVAELTNYNNFYYRYGTWQFRELPSNSIYLEYIGEQNNSFYFETYLKKDYFYENTLYNIVWTDYSSEPYTLVSANFYIKNINTVIINGVLDTSQTFSGDYYQQYEQEQQDIKDIDNISQGVADVVLDDSEVDNILGNFDTSGEIKEYFNYTNFNEDTETVFYEGKNIILYCVTETIESLMKSGDTYIDYQVPGMQTYDRIYSRYFKTPDNGIFFLVKWLLTFGAVYSLYANIFATGESLTKLNVWDAMNKNDADIYIYRM